MKYYANFRDNELIEVDTGLLTGDNVANTEVPEELYEDYKETPDKYIAGTKEIIDEETGETVTVPYPVENPIFEQEQLAKAKELKHFQNAQKAKQAVEQGYVEFKDAQFESNAQTVGDLTATMLLMQSAGLETYSWLSRDDKAVDLTVEDFATLGGLIAQFKNTVWNDKYLTYKNAIAKAKTLTALEKVVIDYDSDTNN